jgi:hypothetical protein
MLVDSQTFYFGSRRSTIGHVIEWARSWSSRLVPCSPCSQPAGCGPQALPCDSIRVSDSVWLHALCAMPPVLLLLRAILCLTGLISHASILTCGHRGVHFHTVSSAESRDILLSVLEAYWQSYAPKTTSIGPGTMMMVKFCHPRQCYRPAPTRQCTYWRTTPGKQRKTCSTSRASDLSVLILPLRGLQPALQTVSTDLAQCRTYHERRHLVRRHQKHRWPRTRGRYAPLQSP